MIELLGFQLRIALAELDSLWDDERRGDYLLKSSIESPLSADSSVWPVKDCQALAERMFVGYSSQPYEAPNGLSLYQLRSGAIAALRESGKNAILVGIGAENFDADRLRAKHFIERVNGPVSQEEGFLELVGFDVCDDWLTSGLMNCALASDTRKGLSSKYSPEINEVGLFGDQQSAREFAVEASKLVLEHAPFHAIAIYLARYPEAPWSADE